MRSLLVILAMTLALPPSTFASSEARPVVAIRPLGAVDPAAVAHVGDGIRELFNADVVVLEGERMPRSAFYAPRRRFRAERLLETLDRGADRRFTKVVGLTAEDISTETETHKDWGIFGLGAVDDRPCVVSTFRLRRGNVARERVLDRLAKVVNHELGHTFGLEHCPIAGCLMEDGSGALRAVDLETGRFCEACGVKLAARLRLTR